MNKLIIIGASGHGKVVADIALNAGYYIEGFLDDDTAKSDIMGYPVLGPIEDILKYQDDYEFIIAIGNNQIRRQISEKFKQINWATLIHPKATIGMNVSIGKGSVVMANATINPDTKIGDHCIVNTASIVEHDNYLEDYVHISPNATLGGTVRVGCGTHIGIGAVVKNNTSISKDCIIGAGGVVVKDIDTSGVYMGVPAKLRG